MQPEALATLVAEAIDIATAPLLARIKALEAREVVHGRDGKDAPPVDLDIVAMKAAALIPRPADGKDGKDGAQGPHGERGEKGERGSDGLHGKDGVPGRDGVDGKDAPSVDLDALATKAAALIPRPLDGKDGRDGVDGKDAPSVDLEALATKAAALIPRPLDGKDGRDGVDGKDGAKGLDGLNGKDGTDGLDGKQGEPGRDGINGEDGKDGVGLVDALIDRDKALVLTMSDGRTKTLGIVVGSDGQPGQRGTDGAPGRDGINGKDGLGFDDMDVEDDGERCFLKLSRDGQVKSFVLPLALDRGTYKPGTKYYKGAIVTARGALWIATKDTFAQPNDGTTATDWRLAVKKGRDGKDGKDFTPEVQP